MIIAFHPELLIHLLDYLALLLSLEKAMWFPIVFYLRSKRCHRLFCPRAEQRAWRTFCAKKAEENLEKGRKLRGQADRENKALCPGAA